MAVAVEMGVDVVVGEEGTMHATLASYSANTCDTLIMTMDHANMECDPVQWNSPSL